MFIYFLVFMCLFRPPKEPPPVYLVCFVAFPMKSQQQTGCRLQTPSLSKSRNSTTNNNPKRNVLTGYLCLRRRQGAHMGRQVVCWGQFIVCWPTFPPSGLFFSCLDSSQNYAASRCSRHDRANLRNIPLCLAVILIEEQFWAP